MTKGARPGGSAMLAGRIVAGLVALAALTSAALAIDDGDRSAFRTAIDRQIAAFRSDDAAAAWSEASPGIQGMFGSADNFMAMVRQGYPPVYRPKRYEFGDAKDAEAGPEQNVRIDDAEGIGWTAIYSFEKQPDGHWAISGCRLVRSPDQAV